MKTKATIEVRRVTSNSEPDFIRMVVGDEGSHAATIEFKMSVEQLGDLVTGRGATVDAEWFNMDKIGKSQESETIEVRIPVALHRSLQAYGDEPTQEELTEFWGILSTHEHDGFKPTYARNVFQNPHRYSIDENDIVADIRYVRWIDNPVS